MPVVVFISQVIASELYPYSGLAGRAYLSRRNRLVGYYMYLAPNCTGAIDVHPTNKNQAI